MNERLRARRARDLLTLLVGLLAGIGSVFLPLGAAAQHTVLGDAGTTWDAEGGDDAGASDPAVASLRETTRSVRDLADDRLGTNVAPRTLFDVPLEDDSAVALDAARLTVLLREIDLETSTSDAGARRAAGPKRLAPDAARPEGGTAVGTPEVSPALWAARSACSRCSSASFARCSSSDRAPASLARNVWCARSSLRRELGSV